MSPLSKNFIRASLIYFFIAAVIGVIMVAMKSYPAQLLFTHVHLNLLGWMSMMIYGVGYHILPRFSGTPLAYPKIGTLQFYLANKRGFLGGGCCFFFSFLLYFFFSF